MFKRFCGAVAASSVALIGVGAPAHADSGRQHFTVLVRQSRGGNSCGVVGAGPIRGVGSCQVEDMGDDQRIVHVFLPGRSFDNNVTTVSASDNSNGQACVDRFTSAATFELTGVSGSYAAAAGNGIDNVTVVFWASRTAEGCPDEPSGGIILARMSGTVTI